MTRKFQLLPIIFLVFACSPSSRIATTNLQDLASFEPGGNIYALPQTRILVTVKAVRSSFTPGPYNQFAKKHLGIEGAESVPNTYWELSNLELGKMAEPDPDHYYSVNVDGDRDFMCEVSELQKQGLMVFPSDFNGFQIYYNDIIDAVKEIEYTDLSIRTFQKNRTRSRVKSDEEFSNPRMPRSSKSLKLKSVEEKAKEAAAFIFKIRKRRFKLVAGQYEVFPEGTALETSIRELKNVEAEYLSLFIGKYEIDTVVRVYSIIPNANEKLQRFPLFRFSEEVGFELSTAKQGDQVVLEITDLDKTEVLKQLQLPVSAPTYQDVLFYRVPDKASVKALFGSHLLHEAEMGICQFGALIPRYFPPKKGIIRRR